MFRVATPELSEKELIDMLSVMHKRGCKDPKALCEAKEEDLYQSDVNYFRHDELQSSLFMICRTRGDVWTKD